MTEEKPFNAYDFYEGIDAIKPEYSNAHLVSHSNRDIFITFGNSFPPDQRIKTVSRLFLNPVTAHELVLNLQSQLQKFKDENEPPPKRK